ncbi:MAG: hypothetical protein AAF598_13870, partial [Bacteroidota bacterium]
IPLSNIDVFARVEYDDKKLSSHLKFETVQNRENYEDFLRSLEFIYNVEGEKKKFYTIENRGIIKYELKVIEQ